MNDKERHELNEIRLDAIFRLCMSSAVASAKLSAMAANGDAGVWTDGEVCMILTADEIRRLHDSCMAAIHEGWAIA